MAWIPYFHFDPPEDKLKPEWCMKVVGYHYYSNVNYNLLNGKNLKEIETFAAGEYDMTPFKMMFKSMRKALKNTVPKQPDGSMNPSSLDAIDTVGIGWDPVPMIPTKLNSAIATVQKVPIEVSIEAQDGLAMQKRQEDITFLKNKPLIEDQLQDIAAKLQIEKVDLGTTKNSFQKYSNTPLGFNLNEPDEENIFVKLVYSLTVEASLEKALAQLNNLLKGQQVRMLEITDQFMYGISAHRNYNSAMTGLPQHEYIFPGVVSGPLSRLPDYSDQTHRIIDHQCTVLELFNYFGNEICDKETLEQIVNGDDGYCKCYSKKNGGPSSVAENNWGTYKINLKYIEVKSVDWVGVVKNEDSTKEFTTDPKKCTDKVWGQNTYGFYWLMNTRYCFGIHRLDYSHRTRGSEAYQNFSSNIYKTKKKSCVELSISENKKAQIADIKLQHALIMALPAGRYIDLRFLREAVTGLSSGETKYNITDLVNLALEKNTIIGDTEGFDGKNNGQMKPVIPIPGGLNINEITGYVQVMVNAAQNISSYTGINEQLTGESANPEGLVGLQKLLINSSINAIYYVTDAMVNQDKEKYTMWCSLLEYAIDEGGAVKQAIVDMIGIDDTEIIDGLDDAPLHKLTCKVVVGQREIEKANFEQKLNLLQQKGVITSADEYILNGVENPKERFAILASMEKKFMKKQDQIRQQEFAQQSALMQQKGNSDLQKVDAQNKGEIDQIYAKGSVEAKLMQLAAQLGLSQQQADGLIKGILQKSRGDQQTQKLVAGIKAKADAQQQQVA